MDLLDDKQVSGGSELRRANAALRNRFLVSSITARSIPSAA
jgi:hypothetical protein